MHEVNRSAIIVVPKQPFLDWLHSVDDTSKDLTLRDMAEEPAIYLVEECESQKAFNDQLRKFATHIFEEQLDGWWTEQSDWPANRTYGAFRRWFECRYHSQVFDLCEGLPVGYTSPRNLGL